jgi:ribokinase
MQLDLVTIGDLNIDSLLMVPHFPGEDDEVPIIKREQFAGGDAANIAVAASRLGLHTALIASVGKDADGRSLLKGMAREGVDTSGVQVHPGESTGSVISMVRKDGQRSMLSYRGANQLLSIEPEQVALFHQSRAIHLSDPLPGIVHLFVEAVGPGDRLISFDPGSITAARGLEAVLPLLRKTKIFMANKAEYILLTGKRKLNEAVDEIRSSGPQIAVVKLGRKGCAVITGNEYLSVPAYKVQVSDSTGAGDAFDAAFLTGVLEEMSLSETARFANAVGALATTQIGAQTGMPTRAQVQEFLSGK